MRSFLQGFQKSIAINDSNRCADDPLTYLHQTGPYHRAVFLCLLPNKWLSPSVEEFDRNDTNKGALHQETTLAYSDDLFPRDCIHKLQKVSIKVGISHIAEQL